MPDSHRADDGFDSDYFESVYRDYEAQNPPRKLAFYREVIESWTDRDLPTRLLDIGCGLGSFLQYMQRSHPAWDFVGSDVSSYAVERNQQQIPGIRFTARSATEDVATPCSFDVVTAFDVVEHVQDRDAVAAAVRRVLVPGGLFVMVVPVYDGVTGPLIRLLDRDPTHVHRTSRDDWRTWVERWFDLIDWWGITRYLLPTGRYVHLPTRWGRRHTPAILIVARNRA